MKTLESIRWHILRNDLERVELQFEKLGIVGEVVGESFVTKHRHIPGLFEKVQIELRALGISGSFEHSIWPEYEEGDYEKAPLLMVDLPELSFPKISFMSRCKVCKKKSFNRDFSQRIPRAKIKYNAFCTDACCDIFSLKLKNKIESASLNGFRFIQADDSGDFFYVDAVSELGREVFTPDEVIDFKGYCSECDSLICDMHFGPKKYKMENWKGADAIVGRVLRAVVYSKKAYEVIRSVEPKIEKGLPVFLE